jgi:hypothetical protein
MKNLIQNSVSSYFKKLVFVAASLIAFSAHAEDRYDTVGKALVEAQKASVVVSSRTSTNVSQAMFEALTYLDELARSGKTDDLTLDKAENTAKLLGETFFMILRHQGIDPEKIDRDLTSTEKAMGVLKEMVYDASRIVSFRKDASGKRTWGVSSTVAREKLTQDSAEKLAQFVDKTVQSMDDTSMREDFLLKFNYMLERGIKVKSLRTSQQKAAKFVYLGLAIATFLHPPVDLVFERTYYSSFYSSIIYMSSFMTLFAVKTKMAGTKTIEVLMQVAADIKNPKQVLDRMRSSQPDVGNVLTCEGMF